MVFVLNVSQFFSDPVSVVIVDERDGAHDGRTRHRQSKGRHWERSAAIFISLIYISIKVTYMGREEGILNFALILLGLSSWSGRCRV